MTVDEIKEIINEKKAIYDLKLDKRVGKKVSKDSNLKKICLLYTSDAADE